MPEATRTRETFNATIKEVCETFEIEKFHEEQQKAIDLLSDGEKISQRIILNFTHEQSCAYRAVLGKFAVVYARTRFFNIFKF